MEIENPLIQIKEYIYMREFIQDFEVQLRYIDGVIDEFIEGEGFIEGKGLVTSSEISSLWHSFCSTYIEHFCDYCEKFNKMTSNLR